MRPLIAGAALALSLVVASPSLASGGVQGPWVIASGGAKTRLVPCGDRIKLCGEIVWLRTSLDKAGRPLLDAHNPVPELRARPLVGSAILTDLAPAGPNAWRGGRLYDPSDGKRYRANLKLMPDDTLQVEGCVAVICRTQTWTRAK
jgi:uncharacterized protein (DUF2147 family)